MNQMDQNRFAVAACLMHTQNLRAARSMGIIGGTNMVSKWWGYVDKNGHARAFRYYGETKIPDGCKGEGPFLAFDRDAAENLLRHKYSDFLTRA